MNRKKLGKITKVYFGIGGYNDAMIGLHLTFGAQSWGVGTSISFWDPEIIKRSDHAQWTEEERSKSHDELVRKISKYLKEAKVDSVDKLLGKPVEIEFEGNCFKDWRILTEVL